MKRRNFIFSLSTVLGGGLVNRSLAGQDSKSKRVASARMIDIEKYRAAAVARWESDIKKLEAKDETETHPDNSILFVGSSSIRFWNDIDADMAPYHPIQRGYGGARWSDLAIFAERLISPHTFRAIVFFVANDISGRADDKSPQEVASLFSYVLSIARKYDKDAPVFYVAVTPTASRFDVWPKIQAGNNAVQAVCRRTNNTHFIGTESLYLDAERKPRTELFLDDRLHLNRDGYIRWAAAIKSHLDTVLTSP